MGRIKLPVYLEGSLCLLLALMLLLLPLKWVLAVILAATVHELCHIAAIIALGGRIYSLHLGFGGIRMETDPLPPGREAAAALAGPLGSAALLLLARWLPRTAVCGGVHCVYNLLPLFPLDGGRALHSIMRLCLPAKYGEKCFLYFQHFFRIALSGVVLLAGLRWGILPAVAGMLLLWRQRKARTV